MSEKWSTPQFKLFINILMMIMECEGGHVDIFSDELGGLVALITSDIPQKNWCKRCSSLYKRLEELKSRWAPIEEMK